jgi:para-nitrobenzyl esterase
LDLSKNFDYGVVVDGSYVPAHPARLLEQNAFSKVPLLIGTVTDEGTFFSQNVKNATDLQPILNAFGPLSTNVTTLYPLSKYGNSAFQVASNIFADRIFVCPVRNLADTYVSQNIPVYKYRWNHQPLLTKIPLGNLGVYHFSEVPYVWKFPPFLLTPGECQISKTLISYWAAFAANGVPGSAVGQVSPLEWGLYKPRLDLIGGGRGNRIRFDEGEKGGVVIEVDDEKLDECVFWTGLEKRA